MSAPIVRPLISQNNQLWENTESKAYLRTLAHQKSRLERQEQINDRTDNVKNFKRMHTTHIFPQTFLHVITPKNPHSHILTQRLILIVHGT